MTKRTDFSKTFKLVKSDCNGQANGLEEYRVCEQKAMEFRADPWEVRHTRKSHPGLTKSGTLLAFGEK